MTQLHRCSPYKITYGANTVRCEDCGRTWLRGPFRYQLIHAGTAPNTTTSDARRKAMYE